jgi:cytochrome b subunit of formate dehydrogenase
MTRGWVDEEWARKHHPKWVEQLEEAENQARPVVTSR